MGHTQLSFQMTQKDFPYILTRRRIKSIKIEPQQVRKMTNCIVETRDLSCDNANADNVDIPSESPTQFDLVLDAASRRSFMWVRDDSEVTIESSHSHTTSMEEVCRVIVSVDHNQDTNEEEWHHSWISAKDDDPSVFTADDK